MIKLLASSLGLLAAAYGTVSDIEIIFLLITIFGMIFSISNIRNAYQDKKALALVPQEERDHAYVAKVEYAKAAFIAEILRFLMQAILFALAGFAATIPEPPNAVDAPLKIAIFGFIFRWGLTFIAGALAYKSYLTKRTRDLIRAL